MFVDSIYNILKNTNGENIPRDKIKVYFEEIAKNIYIIIISGYRDKNDTEQYQCLRVDSWIRLNASNMKTKYGKLYSVHDILLIKTKMYNKYEEINNKLRKDYIKCEQDTIITVSNIITNKQKQENLYQISDKKNNYIFFILYFMSLGINIIFIYKQLCV